MAKQRHTAGMLARVLPLLFFVVMLWVLFTVVSTAVKLLYGYLAIPLLIIALVLNYSVVTEFFSGLIREIKEDTGKGLVKAALTAVGYPFVFGYLAVKAWMKRTLGSKRPSAKAQKAKEKEKKGDYLKYEEVEKEEDFLELEDIDKVKAKTKVKQTRSASKNDNDYDDLFA